MPEMMLKITPRTGIATLDWRQGISVASRMARYTPLLAKPQPQTIAVEPLSSSKADHVRPANPEGRVEIHAANT